MNDRSGSPRERPLPSRGATRAQSHVVGIALLLGITVIALAGLTAGIGSMVDHNAGVADAERVADGFSDVHIPAETTGTQSGTVHLAGGQLRGETRTVRLLGVDEDNGTPDLGTTDPSNDALVPIERIETDALRYENGHRTVTTSAGAILVGGDGGATFYREPSINTGDDPDSPLLLGLPAVDAGNPSISGNDAGTRLQVTAAVEHDRQTLNASEYRLVIETDQPDAWERYFDREGIPATTVEVEGSTAVVARFPGDRPAYLVVHRSQIEVTVG